MSIEILSKTPVQNDGILCYSEEAAQKALRFHQSLPLYEETPLHILSDTAALYQIGSLAVKDESLRFGLNAFKGLGGSYCMFRILCDRLSLDPFRADYSTFLDPEIRRRCETIQFVTATDGNHGKGVSWAAKLFGCNARVLLPKGSVEARRRAIELAGSAVAEITDWNYDRTVQYAASLADTQGWILIQDTSWPGYEQIPRWIIEGYLTLAAEAAGQMGRKQPTHIFLQAGVGAMAGGVAAYFLNRFPDRRLTVSVAEPQAAACIFHSAQAGDGKPHSLTGDPCTIMAGLNCGTPCSIVWPILRDCTSFFCACPDELAEEGMRSYARPVGNDPAIISGESGAVTYGLLLKILQSAEFRNRFGIDKDSVILLINTEGDTDPEGYIRIAGRN